MSLFVHCHLWKKEEKMKLLLSMKYFVTRDNTLIAFFHSIPSVTHVVRICFFVFFLLRVKVFDSLSQLIFLFSVCVVIYAAFFTCASYLESEYDVRLMWEAWDFHS